MLHLYIIKSIPILNTPRDSNQEPPGPQSKQSIVTNKRVKDIISFPYMILALCYRCTLGEKSKIDGQNQRLDIGIIILITVEAAKQHSSTYNYI